MTFLTAETTAVLALRTADAETRLWNKVIQKLLERVPGYKYFQRVNAPKYFDRSESNVTAYLGIIFATDTGYQNRWSTSTSNISEVCLNLNWWTNAGFFDFKFPIMIWNQASDETSNKAWWYGGGVALKDMILVTFSRCGSAFGYLAHSELNAEGLNYWPQYLRKLWHP
ncbi:hypothetical protein N7468_003558 [Penicillium chermesinum]|uniref:Uncharacterized protein n=1 Tax=Penicillium chermesinum TaxID=63820 RepID=A0A9W9P6M3_9EURO|nr:uncharacterized protein N7468_003558 [Penicillium chermesinum]KAJ5238939.1 hypothetical protein N7468_003558 [Penicillium chermesinum]KAJ6164581.1 hypothetical protein N7470_003253 [Penicillium chermesinum]